MLNDDNANMIERRRGYIEDDVEECVPVVVCPKKSLVVLDCIGDNPSDALQL